MERRERFGYEKSEFEPGLSVLKITASVDEREMEPMSCAFQSPSSSPQIFVTSLVLMFICFTLVLTSIQKEDVSIVVVGILGKHWGKKEYRNKMKEMAGKKGQVLRDPDFEILTKRFNELLDALCRKYFFFFFISRFLKDNATSNENEIVRRND